MFHALRYPNKESIKTEKIFRGYVVLTDSLLLAPFYESGTHKLLEQTNNHKHKNDHTFYAQAATRPWATIESTASLRVERRSWSWTPSSFSVRLSMARARPGVPLA